MDAHKQLCGREPDSQYVELAVEVFAMLADATRVRIILALREGELPVNRLAEIVRKSPAAVSQHLAKMRLARMVTTRQDGTRVFYRLENEHARQLVADAISRPNTPSVELPATTTLKARIAHDRPPPPSPRFRAGAVRPGLRQRKP